MSDRARRIAATLVFLGVVLLVAGLVAARPGWFFKTPTVTESVEF